MCCLFCIVLCNVCFVSFYVLFVCKCVLPPGDNPIAVNKYIISRSVQPNAVILFQYITKGDTQWRSCLKPCAKSRKVLGSILDDVISIFSLT